MLGILSLRCGKEQSLNVVSAHSQILLPPALLCMSFLSFFLCIYLVCEPVLSFSPGVYKSFCLFHAQNSFEQGERQRTSLEDGCYMTNPLSFGP